MDFISYLIMTGFVLMIGLLSRKMRLKTGVFVGTMALILGITTTVQAVQDNQFTWPTVATPLPLTPSIWLIVFTMIIVLALIVLRRR